MALVHWAQVRFQHATFLIADVRTCELLPDELREWPSPGLTHILGRSMERSCTTICSELGRCSPRDFPWLAACAALAGAPGSGGCPEGCALRVEAEVPVSPAIWQGECVLRAGAPLWPPAHTKTL